MEDELRINEAVLLDVTGRAEKNIGFGLLVGKGYRSYAVR